MLCRVDTLVASVVQQACSPLLPTFDEPPDPPCSKVISVWDAAANAYVPYYYGNCLWADASAQVVGATYPASGTSAYKMPGVTAPAPPLPPPRPSPPPSPP